MGVLHGMTANGFADQSWYHLIEGAATFLLDFFPVLDDAQRPEVMMRAIDSMSRNRNKALMFKMKLGKGEILATGLNLRGISRNLTQRPEKAWVLRQMLKHAGDLVSKRDGSL